MHTLVQRVRAARDLDLVQTTAAVNNTLNTHYNRSQFRSERGDPSKSRSHKSSRCLPERLQVNEVMGTGPAQVDSTIRLHTCNSTLLPNAKHHWDKQAANKAATSTQRTTLESNKNARNNVSLLPSGCKSAAPNSRKPATDRYLHHGLKRPIARCI